MTSHELKVVPPYFAALLDGRKTFEVRANDRAYQVGDTLIRRVIVRGKKPSAMRNKEDYWEVVEIVPGAGLMQKPDAFGCNLGSYT